MKRHGSDAAPWWVRMAITAKGYPPEVVDRAAPTVLEHEKDCTSLWAETPPLRGRCPRPSLGSVGDPYDNAVSDGGASHAAGEHRRLPRPAALRPGWAQLRGVREQRPSATGSSVRRPVNRVVISESGDVGRVQSAMPADVRADASPARAPGSRPARPHRRRPRSRGRRPAGDRFVAGSRRRAHHRVTFRPAAGADMPAPGRGRAGGVATGDRRGRALPDCLPVHRAAPAQLARRLRHR